MRRFDQNTPNTTKQTICDILTAMLSVWNELTNSVMGAGKYISVINDWERQLDVRMYVCTYIDRQKQADKKRATIMAKRNNTERNNNKRKNKERNNERESRREIQRDRNREGERECCCFLLTQQMESEMPLEAPLRIRFVMHFPLISLFYVLLLSISLLPCRFTPHNYNKL